MRRLLGNLFPQFEQAGLKSVQGEVWEPKRNAVVQAYTESFRTGMIVCTAVSGAALLIALAGYRRGRQDVRKQRENLVHDEVRRQTLAVESAGSAK